MKRISIIRHAAFIAVLFLQSVLSTAQSPQKVSYQSVIRDNYGLLVKSSTVGMKITILQGSASGTATYVETHSVSTNVNGLATLEVGTGTPVIGTFSAIDWSNGPYFLKVETDPKGGTTYTVIGTSQILSVPYALYTKTAEELKLPFTKSSSYSTTPFYISNSGSALYTIVGYSNDNYGIYGMTNGYNGSGVLGTGTGADYSSGLQGRTGEGYYTLLTGNAGVLGLSDANLAVAGTSISGTGGYFSSTSGNALRTIGKIQMTGIGEAAGRVLTSNGTGLATWQDPASGFTLPFSNSDSYSSTPFSVENTGSASYTIAGYSDNGFGIYGKTESGNGAGVNGTGTGANDFSAGVVGFSGEGAYTGSPGNAGVSGMANAYIGVSGRSVSGIGGSFSSVSGSALRTAGQVQLTGIGEAANRILTSDADGFATWENPVWIQNGNNVYYESGYVGIGITAGTTMNSMMELNGGSFQSDIHIYNDDAGSTNFDGLKVGYSSYGYLWNYENTDLIFGTNSFERLTIKANGNIGIGTSMPNYKLDIRGNLNLNKGISSGAALSVYDDEAIWYNDTYFSWGFGGTYNYFDDAVTIGTSAVPGYSLVVNGTAAKTDGGSWSTLSDIRLKNLSGTYDKGLEEIIALKPVKFFYKEGNPRELASDMEQIGFVAQDVQKVFPEAVTVAKDGYLDFNMHAVNVALVNAVKELKAENDKLKADSDKLKAENQLLKSENEQFDKRLSNLEKLMGVSALK